MVFALRGWIAVLAPDGDCPAAKLVDAARANEMARKAFVRWFGIVVLLMVDF
jgi:hypothetical protein